MADTIRKQVLTVLVQTLESATFAAIPGAGVYFGLQAFDQQNNPLPLVSVIPVIEESEQMHGRVKNSFTVTVLAVASLGEENPGEFAEDILGDLISAIFQADFGTVEIIEMRYFGGGVAQYPDDFDIPLLTVEMSLMIEYETVLGDPYNQ